MGDMGGHRDILGGFGEWDIWGDMGGHRDMGGAWGDK